MHFCEQQPAAGEVVDAGIIGERDRASAASAGDLAFKSLGFDVSNPVRARLTVDVMMAVMPLTGCAAPAFGKGVGCENHFGRMSERSHDVGNTFFDDMLEKLARPDQIK